MPRPPQASPRRLFLPRTDGVARTPAAYVPATYRLTTRSTDWDTAPLAHLEKRAILTPPKSDSTARCSPSDNRCGSFTRSECDCPGNTERVTAPTACSVDDGSAAASASGSIPSGVASRERRGAGPIPLHRGSRTPWRPDRRRCRDAAADTQTGFDACGDSVRGRDVESVDAGCPGCAR